MACRSWGSGSRGGKCDRGKDILGRDLRCAKESDFILKVDRRISESWVQVRVSNDVRPHLLPAPISDLHMTVGISSMCVSPRRKLAAFIKFSRVL